VRIAPARRADRGDTLIEVLISIVLLGTAVAATLSGLGATVNATAIERDRATAQMWLQSAVEALQDSSTLDCNEAGRTEPTLRANYVDVLRATVPPPPGWDATQLHIASPIRFWNPRMQFQDVCYDDYGFQLQLVELEVSSPDGEVIEQLQAVIGGE
jgi:prepilin-type N-terminal cleavage/methylation domain-containing protein